MGSVGTVDGALSRKIANLGFLAALLVVFIHLTHVPQDVGSTGWAAWCFVRHTLAGTAVPFFFVVSGFFLARHTGEKGWWRTAVTRRTRTLLVPFLIWCLVPFLLFTFLWPASLPGGECGRCELKASSIAAAFGLHLYTLPEANRALWYVRGLFFLVLVSPLVAILVDRLKGWALLVVFAIYWTLNPGVYDSPNFWLSGRWQVFWKYVFPVEGLFYFTVGFFLQRRPLRLSRGAGIRLGVFGALLGLGPVVVKACGADDCGYLASASIPFTLACLWAFTPSAAWSRFLVGNTFALYVIHPIVLKALAELQVLPPAAGFLVLEWILAVAIGLGVAIVLRKVVPAFAACAFGGR